MPSGAESRVLDAIAHLEPAYRRLLQELVRIPSVAGSEAEAQALVTHSMRDIGLAVDSFDIDVGQLKGHPAFNPSPRSYAGRPCVVGRLAGSGGGRSLALNAHIDTVPVEAPESWTHPPFGGLIEDERLYGRGACDDKAGVVECLLVAHALKAAGAVLQGDLTVASVIEDETTGNGSLACVERGYTADAVIIVDGTWPERFIVSHMGHVSFRIALVGRAGHASSGGPNPIAAVGIIEETLRTFVARRNREHGRPWGANENPGFLNLGVLHSGVWPGSVPGECVLEGQYGFPPPGSCGRAREELRAELEAVAGRVDWPLSEPPSIEFVGLETPPEVGDPGNPIACVLSEVIARRHNAALQESVIVGHCDLRHYTKARLRQTSAACLYGPGGGRNVHGKDENFDLAHLPIVAGNLASVAIQWCGVARDQ